VALAILLEPISSSVLGYLIFAEVPKNSVLVGASVVLVGVAIAAREESRKHNFPVGAEER
jgi:drug/metabolite transporter (DMT)-like permease